MKKAFSLAETLTVLTLIGVVAAMLIPSMYVNISEHKILTMLKKDYSAYNVNIQTVLGEKNCATLSCLRVYDKTNANNNHVDIFGNEIQVGQHNGLLADRTYFNVSSKCVDCFKTTDILPDNTSPAVDNSETTNMTAYILDNSSVAAIKDFGDNCITTGLITDTTRRAGDQDVPVCGILIIDANGTKGPNVAGKDRFAFYIADEPVAGSYLVAIGHNNALYQNNGNIKNSSNERTTSDVATGACTPGNTQDGYNCTAKVMAEGWKINY